jgi:hypothetical protein
MAGFVLAGLSLEVVTGIGNALASGDAVKTVLNASPEAEVSNQPPVMIGLQPDQKDSAKAGSTISWSAKASDPDGDTKPCWPPATWPRPPWNLSDALKLLL